MKKTKLLTLVLCILLLVSCVAVLVACGNSDESTTPPPDTSIDLSTAEISLGYKSVTYDGSAKTPSVTLSVSGSQIPQTGFTVSYSNNINAGTATVTATAQGSGYTGSKSTTFTIEKLNFSNVTVLFNGEEDYSAAYNGQNQEPEITVVYAGKTIASSLYTIVREPITDPGTATVTVTPKASSTNYTGSKEATFTVLKKNLSDAVVLFVGTETEYSVTYNASAQTPSFIVKYNNETVSDSLYTYEYANNTNAGEASLTITIVDNDEFDGEITATFTINALDLSNQELDVQVELENNTFIFSGNQITPSVASVTADGIALTISDFSVSYGTNISAGNATVIITGVDGSNFTGSYTHNFTIDALSFANNDSITVTVDDCTYNGSAQTPVVVVMFGEVTLSPDTDYTIGYSNNTAAGEATVTVTGGGNFKDSTNANFTINKFDLTNANVTFASLDNGEPTVLYNGSAQTPGVTVKIGAFELTLGTDYTVSYSDNNTNPGTVTVTITATGLNCEGNTTTEFTISNIDLSTATVAFGDPYDSLVIFNNEAHTPEVIVTYKGLVVDSSLYSVTYTNNTEVGTATVNINPAENFTDYVDGTNSITFEIASLGLDNTEVTIDGATEGEVYSLTYNGQEQKPVVIVTLNGKAVNPKYYNVAYPSDCTSVANELVITISGNGNSITGEKTVTFNIVALDLSTTEITFDDAENDEYSIAYNGSQQQPAITVNINGVNLTFGTDYTITYGENIQVGTGTVTITFTGTNCVGTQTVQFTIVAANLESATVELSDNSEIIYNGSAQTPTVTVKFEGNTLNPDTDYTVSYSNNINVGTEATVTVTGAGNYSGVATGTFTITPLSLTNNDSITVTVGDCTYNGSAQTPDVTVKFGEVTLTPDTDYTIDYSGNTAAGQATVIVTGEGNFKDSTNSNFTINEFDLTNATIVFTNPNATYNYSGSEHKPAVTVTLGNITFVLDTDYTVTYTNNINAGNSAKATVRGINSCTGSKELTFSIIGTDMSAASILINGENASDYSTIYTGEQITPKIVVKYNNTELTNGFAITYGENTEIGQGSITITANVGSCSGEQTVYFTITEIDLADETLDIEVTLEEESFTYTGEEIIPTVSGVTINGNILDPSNYEISFENNINAGEAVIVVTATVGGKCVNEYRTTFTINALDFTSTGSIIFTNPSVTYTYNGSAQEPGITVKFGDVTLTPNTDYTVVYSGNTGAGQATITVTGEGNYSGELTETFTINALSITDDDSITIEVNDCTYNGEEQEPEITVMVDDVTLIPGTDYTINYSGNTTAGQATITVTGEGNYSGELTETFTINALSITDNDSITIEVNDCTYNGSAQEPNVTVKFGDVTLTLNTDYTVDYANNVDAGTATITVTGKGNFKDSKDENFTINALSITDDNSITIEVNDCTYNGSAQEPNVTVKFGDVTLTLNTDYTVDYANNVDAGTATITVTGEGNYSGELEETFTIAPLDFSNTATITFTNTGATYTYNGSAQEPNVTVMLSDSTLILNIDYTVDYVNNVDVGTATVIATGAGNYTGELEEITFTIEQLSIEDNDSITITVGDCTYNGSAQTPDVTVKFGEVTLTPGTDYSVSYSGNTAAGQATVTVTGNGNFKDSTEANFTINQLDLGNELITVEIGGMSNYSVEFNNQTVEPTVEVKYNDSIIPSNNYEVAYSDNLHAGTATVEITAVTSNNCLGARTAYFTIAKVAERQTETDFDELKKKVESGDYADMYFDRYGTVSDANKPLTIPEGVDVVISSAVKLTLYSITNYGKLFNYGVINCSSIDNYNCILNAPIAVDASINISQSSNNYGLINNWKNDNHPTKTSAIKLNFGASTSTFKFINHATGTINNQTTITVTGALDNNANYLDSFVNNGTIKNSGSINLEKTLYFYSDGSIENTNTGSISLLDPYESGYLERKFEVKELKNDGSIDISCYWFVIANGEWINNGTITATSGVVNSYNKIEVRDSAEIKNYGKIILKNEKTDYITNNGTITNMIIPESVPTSWGTVTGVVKGNPVINEPEPETEPET